MNSSKHTSIFITGASSGIGSALAKLYAKPELHLTLTGRNAERLKVVAEVCRAQGASVEEMILDVCNAEEMEFKIQEADQKHPLTLVIANAGLGLQGQNDSPEATRHIFSTNLGGVLNTVLPTIDLMKKRQSGQLALMSSLASFKGYATKSAYCGSKAAVRIYGEGLRESLAPHNIKVSVICPGFIKTPLTDFNSFKMPFLMLPEKAALFIQKGLEKNSSRIAFPWPTYMGAILMASLPPFFAEKISSRLPYHQEKK